GEPVELPPLAIGIHAGTWRKAFSDYREWVDTWYRPDHPDNLARFFTFTGYHTPGCAFWAPETAEEAIAGIPERGDQLHFIAQKVDRYGDYDHYREDWGLDGLQRFIRTAQERGHLVSHYFQGQVAHDTSGVFQDHGDDWGLKQPDGANYEAWANQCMCYSAEGWREWLASTTAKAVQDLGLDIVYLDCVGWTTGEKFVCHNTNHAHPPEYHRLTTVRELFHSVEEAIRREKPDVALTTEGPVSDLFFNDVDGNEGYGVSFFQSEAYGPPVHFMRFLYPRFKYLDLQTTSADKTGQALFNATATDADPETLPLARVGHRVFHENVDTLTRGDATPHLPTREPGVYCNRFASAGKTICTVWNDNSYRVAGASVPVEIPPGWHVVDAMRHREGLIRRVDREAHLVADLAGRSPGVYAVVPETLRAEIEGMWLCIDWDSVPAGAELVAVLIDGDDDATEEIVLDPEVVEVDLVALTAGGEHRAALKVLRDGLLVDVMELPELAEIDIAPGANVTCGSPDYDHGAHPESVVGQEGSWRFAWDDEPRPGWIQLEWPRPQTFNAVEMSFEREHYSSRDCEIMASDDGATWEAVARWASID
ncbi:MAG TPA: DUF6259 domain-containing protein, partial [Armatimonadota bacterium]|nr:DUF6259 domain-containing protein [Armatimonadota bacterium]